MKEPRIYLSVSDGGYRVINQGLPVSADKTNKTEALEAAVAAGIKITDIDSMAWIGNQGVWLPSTYV